MEKKRVGASCAIELRNAQTFFARIITGLTDSIRGIVEMFGWTTFLAGVCYLVTPKRIGTFFVTGKIE